LSGRFSFSFLNIPLTADSEAQWRTFEKKAGGALGSVTSWSERVLIGAVRRSLKAVLLAGWG
jgi:hypothetical protein